MRSRTTRYRPPSSPRPKSCHRARDRSSCSEQAWCSSPRGVRFFEAGRVRAGGVHSPWHSRTSLTRRDGTGMVGRERLGCSLRLASYCETTRGDIKEIEHICMRKARAETSCFPELTLVKILYTAVLRSTQHRSSMVNLPSFNSTAVNPPSLRSCQVQTTASHTRPLVSVTY